MTMMTGEKTSWRDDRNRVLAAALEIVESETCKGCGTPLWLGHSTNSEVQFRIEASTCYGCAELEKDQQKSNRNKQAKPGERRFVTAYNVWDDKPLPSRYESYREQE